ncbi:glycoside hydrolase family 31 protein [Pontiellaceae bacterium B12227]|nr:glycoside hydrolase family 31 protein [Pontiellaceae bacterium B12227]
MKRLICMMLLGAGLSSFGIGDLQPLENWEPVASGVWKVQIGETDRELAYTDMAARPPRLDALNALPDVPFPFSESPIEFHRSDERMVQVHIPTKSDEVIYGFGLQLDGIKKSGKVLNLNVDHWAKGGGRTHAPVPFYISSRGYGVFFNTARYLKVHVQVGNRKDSPNLPDPVDRNPPPEEPAPGPWKALPDSDAVEANVRAAGLEMIVFSGKSLQDIVARYNLYCGGGVLPPLWGLGFWHRVPSDFNAAQSQSEVTAFARHRIPLDVLGLEPGWMTRSYPCTFEWQKYRFSDPAAFTQRMLDQGIRLNLWENPFVSPEGTLYKKLYPLSGSHLVWLGLVPDYTLPEAQEILCTQHANEHLSIGVSGYKIDEVDGYDRWLWPDHATFPSGTPAEAMRQAYGLIMQNMLYKDLFHKNNTRTYSLVRSSNGGASGLPFVLYSDSYQHSEYITGVSAASLGGILWTPEVRQAGSPEEWRARIQTVCFSPLAMLNAWSSKTKPWEYESVTDDVRSVIQLRMRLLPYLYTAFADYNRKGIPPMRAMVLEQGVGPVKTRDAAAKLDGVTNPYAESVELEQNDQFMFGPSILVAPYYEKNLLKRNITLPKGNWYDFYTGEFVGNGTTIEVATPERIPLFVKEGAVIPMLTKSIDNSRDAYGHPLEVRHYGKQPGSFELYEDDGKTFDYEKGDYALRTFSFADGKLTQKRIRPGVPLFGEVERWMEMTK